MGITDRCRSPGAHLAKTLRTQPRGEFRKNTCHWKIQVDGTGQVQPREKAQGENEGPAAPCLLSEDGDRIHPTQGPDSREEGPPSGKPPAAAAAAGSWRPSIFSSEEPGLCSFSSESGLSHLLCPSNTTPVGSDHKAASGWPTCCALAAVGAALGPGDPDGADPASESAPNPRLYKPGLRGTHGERGGGDGARG